MKMNKVILFITLLGSGVLTFAQTSNFRTRQDGNWTDLTTWEEDTDQDGIFETNPAVNMPTGSGALIGLITILNGHDVIVPTTITVDAVTMNTGSTLTINSGITFRIRNQAGVTDLVVNSGATITADGIFTISGIASASATADISGTIVCNQGGTVAGDATRLFFLSGSTYRHNYSTSAGSIPNASWGTGSTCEISGYTSSTSPATNLTQAFHHLTWNCPNQENIIEFSHNLNAGGDLTIASTSLNTNGVALVFNNSGSDISITVGGSFIITGDSYFLLNQSTGTSSLNCAGFTINNGDAVFDFAEAGTGNVNCSGNLNWAGGTIQATSGIAGFRFNGTTAQTVTATGTVGGTINYIIRDNAIVDIPGNNFLSGSGDFTIEGDGTLRVGSTATGGAIQTGTSNGNIRVGGTRTYTASCDIHYNGLAAQRIGNGHPANVNVTINNASGVILNTATLTIATDRVLTFTSGKLSLSTNTLALNGSVAGMSAANSITLATNSIMTVGGTGNAGTIFFDQTTPGTTNRIINFTLNRSSTGSMTLGNTLQVSGTLTITDGTFNTGGNLVLISTSATSTGQLAGLGSGGAISGNVTVQRFIPNRTTPAWRFLAAPITAASNTTVRAGWQSQIFITGGTGGTGPVGTENYTTDGYDWTSSNNPSMYTYNEAAGGAAGARWVNIGSPTSTNLAAGIGYRVYVRGDRSTAGRLDGSETTQNAVTLSATGEVQTGTFSGVTVTRASAAAADGYNLVGNPYPATLDFNAFRATNNSVIDNIYYTFNTAGNSYVSWNGTTGAAGQYISSGQAVWLVKTNTGSTSITFNEAHKVTLQNGGGFFGKSAALANHLKVKMITMPDSSDSYAFIHYRSDATNGFDREADAVKMGFGLGQIASYNNGSTNYYDINSKKLSSLETADTVNLVVNVAAVNKNYVMTFSDQSTFPSNINMFLEDRYLNMVYDLRGIHDFAFSTTSDPASVGSNRFRIILGDASALPVTYKTFTAEKAGKEVILKWETASEADNDYFEVQRSTDNISFEKVAVVKGRGTSTEVSRYITVDPKPFTQGMNYYRIKQVDRSAKFNYSPVLSVDFSERRLSSVAANSGLVVFPVPAREKISFSLSSGEQIADTDVQIYDVMGKLVKTQHISAGASSIDINDLGKGIYFISLDNGSEKVKFIKE